MIHKTKSHPTQSRGRPNTALQKALDLHRKGQFAPAAKAFHSILRLQPKQYGIWLLYIESLLLSEQHAAAETAMQQCRGLGFNTPELDALASKIGLPPKHREQSLIDIFQQDGAVELAARMFIAQYPNWPLGWDILGSHFHREGDYAQAIQVRTEAAARFPEYVDFQVKLALSLQALERLVEAETVMQKAFTQAPTRVDILAHVGSLTPTARQSPGAEEIYRQCVTLAPDNAAMHSNLGELLLDTGRIVEAQIEIHKAVTLDPQLAEAQCNLGHLERELGRKDTAIVAYQRALELKPTLTEAEEALAELVQRG